MKRVLQNVLFLAAHTARSQGYAQAMIKQGLAPAATILYGPRQAGLPGQTTAHTGAEAPGLSLTDLSETLLESCQTFGTPTEFVDGKDLNSDALLHRVKAFKPSLVVFSGYGGQIVRPPLLDTAPFLHVHSGWLPAFRGSTTIYYQMLAEGRCAASALLLVPELDAGSVLARRWFALPPRGVDIDYIYDSTIRGVVLADVLEFYAREGQLPAPVALADEETPATYFVIHPVLKHLARLRTEAV